MLFCPTKRSEEKVSSVLFRSLMKNNSKEPAIDLSNMLYPESPVERFLLKTFLFNVFFQIPFLSHNVCFGSEMTEQYVKPSVKN